jgi:tripartite-type tricarboxylate transporter receptor subunit TctC
MAYRLSRLVGLAAAFSLAAASLAQAQESVADFYRGRVVNIIVGFSVGAGYDVHGRLMARHIGKHIPGNPTVIPLNMEGAGSLKLVNWLYNVAPKDGTVIGVPARGIPFEPLVGIGAEGSMRFDASKFTWLGSTTDEVSVCVTWERTGIDSFDDLYEKELIVGGVGIGGDPDTFPRILNGIVGTKFRVVSGYPGGADIDFAMERGEVDGRCGWSWASIKSGNQRWLDENKIKPLLQLSLKKHPELTAMGVPWVMDLAKTEEDRQLLRLIFARGAVGRPFIAPPNIPPERAAALRKAFMDTVNDPAYLQEAHRMRLEIVPITGEEAQSLIAEAYKTPRPILDRARAMLETDYTKK